MGKSVRRDFFLLFHLVDPPRSLQEKTNKKNTCAKYRRAQLLLQYYKSMVS